MDDGVRIRDGAVEWREIDGEIIGLDLRRSEYFALNHTAARMWRRLLEGCSRRDLAADIAAAFAIDPGTAQRDVDRFLEELGKQDLIEPAAKPDAA